MVGRRSHSRFQGCGVSLFSGRHAPWDTKADEVTATASAPKAALPMEATPGGKTVEAAESAGMVEEDPVLIWGIGGGGARKSLVAPRRAARCDNSFWGGSVLSRRLVF